MKLAMFVLLVSTSPREGCALAEAQSLLVCICRRPIGTWLWTNAPAVSSRVVGVSYRVGVMPYKYDMKYSSYDGSLSKTASIQLLTSSSSNLNVSSLFNYLHRYIPFLFALFRLE